MKWQIQNRQVNIPVRLILGILLFIVLLFGFALLAHEVVRENEDWFDTKVFAFLRSHSTPGMIEVFSRITFLGSFTFLLPAYILMIIYLLYTQRKEDAINTTLLALISTLSIHGLKAVYARKRPDLPLLRELSDYSFPSGHTVSAFVFSCVLIWILWKSHYRKGWKIIFTILLVLAAAGIGISRIVLRYHYASDVVAGFCVALAWVLLYFFIAGKLKKYFANSEARG